MDAEWSLEGIKRLLDRDSIDYSRPGFYDSDEFVEQEKKDDSYLENYAAFVLLRSYPKDYIARARSVIRDVSEFLFSRLSKDGRLGACVDMAATLTRFLDRQEVWNFPVRGCLTASFPEHTGLPSRHFAPLTCGSGVAAAHMWVIAPPFRVIDLTVSRQPYPDAVRQLLPDCVLAEHSGPMVEDPADWFGSDGMQSFLARRGRLPTMKDVMALCQDAVLRSRQYGLTIVDTTAAQFRYSPCAMFAPDAQLEEMRNLCLSGEYPAQLFRRYLKSSRLPH